MPFLVFSIMLAPHVIPDKLYFHALIDSVIRIIIIPNIIISEYHPNLTITLRQNYNFVVIPKKYLKKILR